MTNEVITIDKVKEDEQKFMNDIVVSKGNNLPDNVEDVLKVFEFTDLKAKAFKLVSDKTSKLEEQAEIHQSAIKSGQQWGIAALYAQKRMGEITRNMQSQHNKKGTPLHNGVGKIKILKENGISRNTYESAEQISKHPDILDKVIEKAKENNDIPTKAEVLREIRYERIEQAKKDREVINQNARNKKDDRLVKEKDKLVKEYYESIKGFESALSFAIAGAKRGKFSTEGKNFLINKHSKLKNLMNQLEDLI